MGGYHFASVHIYLDWNYVSIVTLCKYICVTISQMVTLENASVYYFDIGKYLTGLSRVRIVDIENM